MPPAFPRTQPPGHYCTRVRRSLWACTAAYAPRAVDGCEACSAAHCARQGRYPLCEQMNALMMPQAFHAALVATLRQPLPPQAQRSCYLYSCQHMACLTAQARTFLGAPLLLVLPCTFLGAPLNVFWCSPESPALRSFARSPHMGCSVHRMHADAAYDGGFKGSCRGLGALYEFRLNCVALRVTAAHAGSWVCRFHWGGGDFE